MTMIDVVANTVAALHILYFLFIVGGTVAIVAGDRRRWPWIDSPWFRLMHLASVYVVLFEDVAGLPCPLNQAEWTARTVSTGTQQSTAGLGGLLDYLLFHLISGRVLNVIYWSLGVLLPILLWLRPIRRPSARTALNQS